jgi:hypothetical protein
MDFITDLPLSNGFDSIMVVVDHGLSKGVIYIPTNKKGLDAKKTIELYVEHVWKRFGWPKIIISDRGPQFSSQTFQEVTKAMGITSRMSTAFHPQTDGETERVNQELEIYLRIYCGLEPEKWSSYLAMAEFAHNIRVHDAIKNTPFNVILGTEPIGIPSAVPRFTAPSAEEKTRELQRIRHEALASRELAGRLIEERIKRKPAPFTTGQQVWLSTKNLKLEISKKLAPKRIGPFTVEKQMGKYTYRLKLPPQYRIHPVFDQALLSPFNETQEHGENFLRPPPDILEGEEEYEIETIINHRRKGKGLQYLIRWKGYASSDDSWVSEKSLEHSQDTLDEYKRAHKL